MDAIEKQSGGLAGAIRDVTTFNVAMDLQIRAVPTIPDQGEIELCEDLLREEIDELRDAWDARDLVGISDGITDTIYILIGIAIRFGIPLADVWAEVHGTNIAKVDPATGKVTRRADGKILKPAGWKPPAIALILDNARMAEAQRVAAATPPSETERRIVELERVANGG